MLVWNVTRLHALTRGGGGGGEGDEGPFETRTTTATGTSKNNRFNEQNNNSARASRFFVHFFAVPGQLDVKWPNFKFTWERERQGDKFYHLCPNLSAFPSLQLQPKSPSFK